MTFFGSKGTAHIGSEDFAAFVNSLHGGDAIFSIEDSMACTMTDANTASVALGACVLQGYFYHHEEVDDLEVANGSIGYNRHDLVVATYTLGTDSNDNAVQDVYLRVIQGTATVGEASDPEYADGSIAGGDTLVDFPLYRLTIEGVSTPAVERIMALEAPIQSQVDANASAITALGESVSQISDRNTTAFDFDGATTITRVGHVVMFTLVANTRNAIGAWVDTRICTVSPAPKAVTYAVSRTNDGETGLVQINVDGSVYFRTLAKAAVSNENLRTTTVYLC